MTSFNLFTNNKQRYPYKKEGGKKKCVLKKITFLLVLFLPLFSIAQHNSKKLKQQEAILKKKIENTKNLIDQTRKTEQLKMTELAIINHQIAYRESLMENINHQMRRLDQDLINNQKEIQLLENKLKKLKEEYAKMLQYAFKNRDENYKLLYVFSAKSYSESYHRLKYIEQYTEYRQRQVEEIKKTQAKLNQKIEEIEAIKAEKKNLATEKQKEKQLFLKDKESQQSYLKELQANENKLKLQLQKQEAKRKRIARAIKKAIEAEIAAEAKKNKIKGFVSTPETTALSKTFATNKGKLPWPVFKGEITGKYGKQQHDVVSTAYIENNGIDITTTKGANVRAVFGGKVTSVFVIPGAGKVVMVSHGNYRTVYSNLESIYVKKGDMVSIKQKIGKLLPAPSGNVSEAHFEIWHITSSGMKSQNPALWIYTK